MIELAANLLVAFLLVLTTIWCVLLYRRLGRLRVERSDIEAFVTAIDPPSRRAERRSAASARARSKRNARWSPAGAGPAAHRPSSSRLVDSAGADGAPGRDAPCIRARGHGGKRARASPAERLCAATGSSDAARRRGGATRRPEGRKIDAELLRALEALR